MPFSRRLILSAICAAVVAAVATPVAVAETYTFKLTKRDKKALAAKRKADRMNSRAERSRIRTAVTTDRIMRIEELLEQAEGDESRLRAALQQRMVDRYKDGSSAELEFLLDSGNVNDAVDRASVLSKSSRADASLAASHQLSVARLEHLRTALENQRDADAERAASLEDKAAVLEEQLFAARDAHLSADQRRHKGTADDRAAGTWSAVTGTLPDSIFTPMGAGLPWQGNVTPARPSSPEQIAAVLADTRIDIYAGGRLDITMGRIDGRLLDALRMLADTYGSLSVTSLITGHGVYTTSGNVSAHTYGCAADIGTVGGVVINSAAQTPGSVVEQAVRSLASLPGDLAPHQVISLYSLGGSTLSMGDHNDHIHLGYSC